MFGDLGKMMKQAQELQSRMAAAQEEIAQLSVSGSSGAGLVQVMLTGKGDLAGLKLDPSLLKEDEAEILEDLIVAAHADARQKLEAAVAEKMQGVTGGLNLPAGLKLPF